MKITIFRAIERLGYEFNEMSKVVLPILGRMKEVDHSLMPVTQLYSELVDKCTDPNNYAKYTDAMFHLVAYMYLIDVEGIFDELVRMLYFFTVVSRNCVPIRSDLEKMTVWDITKRLRTPPVFLHNWEKHRHIRNAIGHARARYDSQTDTIRFLDLDEKTGKVTYDNTMSMFEFYEAYVKLIDTSAAFRFTLELLSLYEYSR